MAMGLISTMNTEASGWLKLLWLASPALPIGGFSYSEGLEAAIDAGLVRDEASVAHWLLDQLHVTQARGDLALIAQAVPAWQAGDLERLQALATWVQVSRESAEMRLQSEQMGRSLLDWLRNLALVSEGQVHTADRLGRSYPLVLALALASTGQPMAQALQAVVFGWAENMVQAAVKSLPLGQSAGQRILAKLVTAMPAAVEHALSLDDDHRQAFSPMLAILSSRHETQYSRLFRS